MFKTFTLSYESIGASDSVIKEHGFGVGFILMPKVHPFDDPLELRRFSTKLFPTKITKNVDDFLLKNLIGKGINLTKEDLGKRIFVLAPFSNKNEFYIKKELYLIARKLRKAYVKNQTKGVSHGI